LNGVNFVAENIPKNIPEHALRAALERVNGEPPVLARDVDWDLKSPCSDCPFLRTSPFHEGVAESLQSYMESIDARRFAHTCHKTDPRPKCDGPHTWDGRPKACAGATMMLLKTGAGTDLQLPLLEAAVAGKLDLADMTARANADNRVFKIPELLSFYLVGMRKMLRRSRRRKARKRGDP
jgi:hypothetical protein